jgi:hypothetical protein
MWPSNDGERYWCTMFGLDVSLKQTSICVVNQAGSVVREGVVDSDPAAIAAFVRSKAPGAQRIGLETGSNVLLTRVPKWSGLKAWGIKLAKRNGSARAGSYREENRGPGKDG